MIVTRIACKDFRNLRAVDLAPVPGLNILCGDNAQGKTNLVEAIWLFSGARSFRAGSDASMIQFDADSASIEVHYRAGGREQSAAIRLGPGKRVWRNEIELSSVTELAGGFPCVVFSPSHLSLVKDGPEVRRRFLDTLLGQVSPRLIPLLGDYRKTVTQRTALLRDIPRHSQLLDMLPVYDEMLARQGGRIARARNSLVRQLADAAADYYDEIAGRRERLSLSLKTSFTVLEGEDPDSRYRRYLAILEQARQEDLRLGMTTAGPHRDDLEIFLDGHPIRLYGSQGQQRSALLALKLAECRVLGDALGEEPVILLDDVLSELDPARQSFILSHLGGRQIFITACEPTLLTGADPGARIYRVKNGEISV